LRDLKDNFWFIKLDYKLAQTILPYQNLKYLYVIRSN
jgi:hypothetical protein